MRGYNHTKYMANDQTHPQIQSGLSYTIQLPGYLSLDFKVVKDFTRNLLHCWSLEDTPDLTRSERAGSIEHST